MNRRFFIASCTAAALSSEILGPNTTRAASVDDKPFADAKLRFAAPLDWFPGRRIEEKLDGVAAWGLPAYEWLWPIGDPNRIREKADALGLELSCIVGTGAISEGWMVQPEDHNKTVEMFEGRVEMAQKLNCKKLVGLTGNLRHDISVEEQTGYVIECLKRLAPIAEKNGVLLIMEALNTLVDHPGFFLTRTDQTVAILKEVNSPNVKMLFDIYHQQITEGNVIRNIRENIDFIGHFHVADNPGRQEPGTGELNYTNIFNAIVETGYSEMVALECGHATGSYENTLYATLKHLV